MSITWTEGVDPKLQAQASTTTTLNQIGCDFSQAVVTVWQAKDGKPDFIHAYNGLKSLDEAVKSGQFQRFIDTVHNRSVLREMGFNIDTAPNKRLSL